MRIHFNIEILLFIFLITTGLYIRFYISWLDIDTLVKFVADDTFIGLTLARNFVIGKGVSFDGINQANGIHPLYQSLVFLISEIFPTGLVVHIVLSMLSIFSILTTVFIFKIMRFFTTKTIAYFGVFFWLFNPWIIFVSLAGVEVPISVFLVSVIIYFYLKIKSTKQIHSKNLIILGILCGLAFLSRSDTIFLPIIIFFSLLYHEFKNSGFSKASLIKPTIFFIITFLIALPWFIWSFKNFGTIIQGSGQIQNYLAHNNYLLKYKTYFSVHIIGKLTLRLYYVLKDIFLFLNYKIVILTSLLVLYYFLRGWRFDIKRLYNKFKPLNFVSLLLVSLIAFYSFIHWSVVQIWYLFLPLFISSIYLILFFSILNEKYNKHILLMSSIILFTIIFITDGINVYEQGIFPWQKEMYDATLWLKENVKENERIGSFNSGIFAYYSNLTVINLDGFINNDVHEYLINKQLDVYIKNENISYIIDYEYAINTYGKNYANPNYFNMMYKIATFNGTLWDSNISVYKINQIFTA